ncbi:hypothetical protein VTK26DRAFT_243 [Humicola hyalothermophila]
MWLTSSFRSAIALLAWSTLLFHVAAQSDNLIECNALKKECPPNPALGTTAFFNFNQTPPSGTWEVKDYQTVHYDPEAGLRLRINKHKDSPTLRSLFYIFWGRTEIWIKAAPGRGIISSVMFLSDTLDEIDWEFLGSNDTHVLTNYYGKGDNTSAVGAEHVVPGKTQGDYHNYTTIWKKEFLEWWVDGTMVRRLEPKDARNGDRYPQTPMRLSLGIWAGGDPDNAPGVREWAGGDTDYSQGPFDMWVKSVHIEDYTKAKEYIYTDRSGHFESIRAVEGNSTVKEIIEAEPRKSFSERWDELPEAAKIAVYAGAASLGGIMIVTAIFYCIRQRRRGAQEAKLAAARAEAERVELERFKKAGIDPDSFVSSASEYNAKEMRRDGSADDDSYSIAASPAVTAASPLDFNSNPASTIGPAAVAGAGAGAAAAGAAAMNSARAASPSVYSERAGNRSPAPRDNPTSPSSRQYGQPPASPNRSYSGPNAQMPRGSPAPDRGFTSPDPQMRVGSPAPLTRSATASPGAGPHMAHPQPQRSYTAGGYGGEQQQHRGGGRPGDGYGYGGGGQGDGGNQGYWGGNGGYR